MVVTVLALAGVALVLGLVALIGGLSLISTDYGQTYFLAGAVLMGSGLVTLALGLALKAVLERLSSAVRISEVAPQMAPPALAPALPEIAPAVAEASMPAPSLPPAPPEAEPATLPEAPAPKSRFSFPKLGGVAAAGVAAGAAIAATSGDKPASSPETTDAAVAPSLRSIQDKLIEDFERDLFAGPGEQPAHVDLDLPVDLASPTDLDLPAVAEPAEAVVEPLPPALPEVAETFEAGPPPLPEMPPIPVPELNIELPPVLAPKGQPVEDLVTTTPFAVEPPALPDLPAVPELPALSEPPALPELPAVPPIPSAPSGLIPDDDTARIAAEPELAPLDTLEVVGAYDSGGTRFTMYSDGSVVASGPQGDRRFPSLDDLRRYIDQAGKA